MLMRLMGTSALVMGLMGQTARADDAVQDRPGPIDSLQDLQDTGKMLFKLADLNNDGQISQQEAIEAGYSLVGGQFFRADKDGNGTVTKEEAQEAREAMLAQRPFLRTLVERAKAKNPEGTAAVQKARQGMMSLVDANNDGQIQASELKQMVQTTVQSVYAAADTNRDGQMNPSEVNAALAGAARSIAQAAYRNADADGNGQLSQAEFEKALVEPAKTIFVVMDSNNDGQLSPQEFQAAERTLASQIRLLRVPEPANSPKNLIESGRKPTEVAPVPNFNAVGGQPAQPQPQPQPQPVVPAQPRR